MHLEALLKWLHHYLNRAEVIYLVQGFSEGFYNHYEVQCVYVMSRNPKSVKGLGDVIRYRIKKELEGGCLSGPHSSLQFRGGAQSCHH